MREAFMIDMRDHVQTPRPIYRPLLLTTTTSNIIHYLSDSKAGEYQKENQSLERKVKDLDAQVKNPVAAYKHLTAQNETLKVSLAKL